MIKKLKATDHILLHTSEDIEKSGGQNYRVNCSESIVVLGSTMISKGWAQSDKVPDSSAHPVIPAVSEDYKYLSSSSIKDCIVCNSAQPSLLCWSFRYMTDLDKTIYTTSTESGKQPELEVTNKRAYQSSIKNQSGCYQREIIIASKDFEYKFACSGR